MLDRSESIRPDSPSFPEEPCDSFGAAETQTPTTSRELKDLNIKSKTINKRYLDNSEKLTDEGKQKYANMKILKVTSRGSKWKFWQRRTAKTKYVAVSSQALAAALRKQEGAADASRRAQWEDGVSDWKEWTDPTKAPDAVSADFLDGVSQSTDPDATKVLVPIMRYNAGGKAEVGQISIDANKLAEGLGVTERAVRKADDKGDIVGLIIRARLTPNAHLDETYSTDETGLDRDEARAIAIAVDGLRDESRVFGSDVGKTKTHLNRYEFALPADIEKGETPEGELPVIYVHLGEGAVTSLGTGSFGQVTKSLREALGTKSQPGVQRGMVAQKVPRQDASTTLAEQKREADIGVALKDVPFVLQTHHYSEIGDWYSTDLSIVSEICDGGDVASTNDANQVEINAKLTEMEPADRWQFFADALKGVDGIHKKGFVHRDLKGENIMIKTGKDGKTLEPRIVDFGIATEKGALGERKGTPLSSPPEVFRAFRENPHNNVKATPEWDAFSMGGIGLECILNKPTFWQKGFSSGSISTMDQLADQMAPLDDASEWVDALLENEDLPDDIVTALKGLLHGDPEKRMKIPDAIALIEQGVAELRGESSSVS